MNRRIKYLLIVATIFITSNVLWGVASEYGKARQASIDKILHSNDVTYDAPQELVGLADQIGLTVADLRSTHAQIGASSSSAACPTNITDGCYDPNTDTIRLGVNAWTNHDASPVTTLAYEYSHYIWQNLKNQSEYKPALNSLYQTLSPERSFASTKAFFLTEGVVGSDAYYSEMFSVACTQTNDSELDPNLLAECNSFLPNRSPLQRLY